MVGYSVYSESIVYIFINNKSIRRAGFYMIMLCLLAAVV